MRQHLRLLAARHEPPGRLLLHLKSGTGAALGIALVAGLAALTGRALLVAPLGATVVLLFGQPRSPLAQPAHVFGGYLLGTVVGVAAALAAPGAWWAAALAVGLSVTLMAALRVTHPPAGAVPLVAIGAPDGGLSLFPTLLMACLGLVGLALLVHRLGPRVPYPRPPG